MHLIGTPSRDLPACSIVPQPTTLPRSPLATNYNNSLREIMYTKCSIFWNMMPCSPLEIRRFSVGTCRRHFQDQRISHARNQHEASYNTFTVLDSMLSQNVRRKLQIHGCESVKLNKTSKGSVYVSFNHVIVNLLGAQLQCHACA
jgi:hypothetical protein